MIRPEFYDDFTCLADRCIHSCCRGWEIDIDQDTAEYYEKIPGKFGEEIRQNIFYDEEGCHFRMQNDSCPFLEKSGLCRLIKHMGEDVLCDICFLHPRFFFELGGLEFAGLGLCCEGVCELLMKEGELLFIEENAPTADLEIRIEPAEEIRKEPVATFDMGKGSATAGEIRNAPAADLEIRIEPAGEIRKEPSKSDKGMGASLPPVNNGMPKAMTMRELFDLLNVENICEEDLIFVPERNADKLAKLIEVYQTLEPIDEAWEKEMETLKNMMPQLPKLAEEYRKHYRQDVYQKVFYYILYRQLDYPEDEAVNDPPGQKLKRLINYAKMSTQFIYMTDALWGDTKERIRRWSEQVEYSTENVRLLFAENLLYEISNGSYQ